jgi:hypothetical protein
VSDERFPPDKQLAIQKAFFDHVWQQPLSAVVESLNHDELDISRDMANLAKKLNEDNRLHQGEMASFGSVLSDELRGVAEIADPILAQIIARIGDLGPDVGRSEENSKAAVNLVHGMLSGEHRSKLPTIHVHACLCALFRWEYRSKVMTGNDLFDFGHAAAALGYCDAFFTEAGVTRSITHQRLKLDLLYNCVVTNDVNSALSLLRALS